MRLLTDYVEAVRIYSDLLGEMKDLIASGLEVEAALIQRHCRDTWQAVERARLALYRHEADHSCSQRPQGAWA